MITDQTLKNSAANYTTIKHDESNRPSCKDMQIVEQMTWIFQELTEDTGHV